LDDAQNTTLGQMKMFLTRFGFGSKIIVTGDITQIDLPESKNSGLVKISNILNDIKGIEFVNLEKNDVVRHGLVKEIIKAYEKSDNNTGSEIKKSFKENRTKEQENEKR
ncbi:MAG: PhoH family protein, partial [Atribacterota bacterium]|nr:PhoH family protein [Atribacterota bacterium]